MTASKSDRLRAEAMNYASERSYRCTTTSLNPGVSPYELGVGHRLTFDHFIPFGIVGYLRRPKPEHKLAPRGSKCIMLGIDTNYPQRPSASATSPPAKSSCVRPSYSTPPPTPERQFPGTRRLRWGGRDTGIIRRDPRKPPTTYLHWGAGRPSRRSQNRNSMSQRGRVGRKVLLGWREWSMRRGGGGLRGQLRRS